MKRILPHTLVLNVLLGGLFWHSLEEEPPPEQPAASAPPPEVPKRVTVPAPDLPTRTSSDDAADEPSGQGEAATTTTAGASDDLRGEPEP